MFFVFKANGGPPVGWVQCLPDFQAKKGDVPARQSRWGIKPRPTIKHLKIIPKYYQGCNGFHLKKQSACGFYLMPVW